MQLTSQREQIYATTKCKHFELGLLPGYSLKPDRINMIRREKPGRLGKLTSFGHILPGLINRNCLQPEVESVQLC